MKKNRNALDGVNRRTVIRAKSPLRISFAGGGTDIPAYYEKMGGAVLSTTISRSAHVALLPRSDPEVHIRSFDLGYSVRYPVEAEPPMDGVLDLAKAAIRRVGCDCGFELIIRSEAPAGSGLGGSSALTAAVIGAVAEYTGVMLTEYELAELNYVVEREDLNIAGGRQDQYATTFGGFNRIEFFPDRVFVTPLRIPRDILNDLEAHLMLCYTGQVRPDLGLVAKQLEYFEESRHETVRGMERLHAMVDEMMEALLTGDLRGFGALLHEAYLNKLRMNPHVTTPAIVKLYETARKNGAVGGKLCGAGGGGYLLLFVDSARRHDVRVALEAAGGQFTDFALDHHGLQVWRSPIV